MFELKTLLPHRLARPPRVAVWLGPLLGGLALGSLGVYLSVEVGVKSNKLSAVAAVLMALGFAGFCSWSLARWQARRVARRALALGVSFAQEVLAEELSAYADLPLFRLTEGLERADADNRMEGTFEGRTVVVMEYYYEGEFRRNEGDRDVFRHQARQTLVILPDVPLPDFALYPDGCLWHETDPLWYEALGLPWPAEVGDKSFRRRYELRGPDPDALWGLFTDARVDYFNRVRGWSVECWNRQLLIYREEEVVPIERLKELLRQALDIFTVLTEGPRREAAPPGRSEQIQAAAPTRRADTLQLPPSATDGGKPGSPYGHET
jgi:hypothetical protein